MLSRVAKLHRLLPIVAIGTIADCQSIVEYTNRSMTKAGIAIMIRGNHHIDALTELFHQLGFQEKISSGYTFTSQDIAFVLSPILNSSGRLSHARHSIITLLKSYHDTRTYALFPCEEDMQSLEQLVQSLIQTNEARKEMVLSIIDEIQEEAEKQKDNECIVVYGNWSKGVIGLIASRLVTMYDKPVAVISTPQEDSLLTSQEIHAVEKALCDIIDHQV